MEKLPISLVDKVKKLGNGASPSSGLLAIYHQLEQHNSVCITGFDWWEKKEHHYYGEHHFRGDLHKPQIEKQLIDSLIHEDKVFIL